MTWLWSLVAAWAGRVLGRACVAAAPNTPHPHPRSPAQIGGTAKDYWKSYIQAEGKYVEKGYVATDSAVSLPPGFGLLVATVFGLLAVVGVVVSRAA